jgi:hypothetical protein
VPSLPRTGALPAVSSYLLPLRSSIPPSLPPLRSFGQRRFVPSGASNRHWTIIGEDRDEDEDGNESRPHSGDAKLRLADVDGLHLSSALQFFQFNSRLRSPCVYRDSRASLNYVSERSNLEWIALFELFIRS